MQLRQCNYYWHSKECIANPNHWNNDEHPNMNQKLQGGLTRESVTCICNQLWTIHSLALDAHIEIIRRLPKVHTNNQERCQAYKVQPLVRNINA